MLNDIKKAELQNVFIIDHHEITQEVPENVTIVNPMLYDKEKISAAGLTYLFCKEMNPENIYTRYLTLSGLVKDNWIAENVTLIDNISLNKVRTERDEIDRPSGDDYSVTTTEE